MKYIVIIGAFLLLIGGAFWYTSTPNMMGMNMDGMMMAQNISEEDNLSILHDKNVPEVQPTQVVELNDGDTFDLTASIVKQEVGNRTVK